MRKIEAVGKGKSYEPGHYGKALKGDQPLVIVMGKWYNSIKGLGRGAQVIWWPLTRCEKRKG